MVVPRARGRHDRQEQRDRHDVANGDERGNTLALPPSAAPLDADDDERDQHEPPGAGHAEAALVAEEGRDEPCRNPRACHPPDGAQLTEEYARSTYCVLRYQAPLANLLGLSAELDELGAGSAKHWVALSHYALVPGDPGPRAA